MPTREINRNELRTALDQFSYSHRGWRTVLEDIGSTENHREAQNLPLVGISIDDRDNENQIIVLLGGQPDRHLTHIITRPQRVWITEEAGSSEETMEIEAEDGSRTIVHLNANVSGAAS